MRCGICRRHGKGFSTTIRCAAASIGNGERSHNCATIDAIGPNVECRGGVVSSQGDYCRAEFQRHAPCCANDRHGTTRYSQRAIATNDECDIADDRYVSTIVSLDLNHGGRSTETLSRR